MILVLFWTNTFYIIVKFNQAIQKLFLFGVLLRCMVQHVLDNSRSNFAGLLILRRGHTSFSSPATRRLWPFVVAREFKVTGSTLYNASNCSFIHSLRSLFGLLVQNVERSQKRFKDSAVLHMLHQERVVLGQEGKTLDLFFFTLPQNYVDVFTTSLISDHAVLRKLRWCQLA